MTEFESRLPNSSVRFSLERGRPATKRRRRALSLSVQPQAEQKNKNVFRSRKATRKQGQEGCPVHRHGRRSVVLFPHVPSSSFSDHRHPYLTGASGTGRTTFVNTLCESDVLAHKQSDSPETAHIEEGIRIKPVNVGPHCPSRFMRVQR